MPGLGYRFLRVFQAECKFAAPGLSQKTLQRPCISYIQRAVLTRSQSVLLLSADIARRVILMLLFTSRPVMPRQQ